MTLIIYIYIYIIITLYGPKFEQFRCSDVSVLLGRISASSGLRIGRLLERFRKKIKLKLVKQVRRQIYVYLFQDIHFRIFINFNFLIHWLRKFRPGGPITIAVLLTLYYLSYLSLYNMDYKYKVEKN